MSDTADGRILTTSLPQMHQADLSTGLWTGKVFLQKRSALLPGTLKLSLWDREP